MRVGVLTFHRIYNPGAYFQAYASMRLLDSLGHRGQVIDYTSPPHRFRPWWYLLCHPKTVLRLRDWRETFGRDAAFRRSHSHLNMTRPIRRRAELANERFDAALVGADIVWNYQLAHLGRDPVYFGEGIQAERLIAFAPSCGACDLSQPIPLYVRQGLPRFSAIAVRDRRTAELVEKVLGRRPPIIADPALGLNLSDLPETHQYDGDYLLVYSPASFVDAAAREHIVRFARERGLRIVAVCYRQDWADENDVPANPFQWLGRIRCARYVYTGTFHGTIFCLKTGKAFATQYNPHIESKTRPMLERLACEHRVWDGRSGLESVFDEPWDVAGVHARIDEMAATAREYLVAALAGRAAAGQAAKPAAAQGA